MANNYIAIDPTKRHGAVVFNAATQIADSRDRLAQLKADMDAMVDGADYSTIETVFGVGTGKGQTLYNLVAGAVSEMAADTNLTNLLNWIAVAR